MDTLPELVLEMNRLIHAANENKICLRVFGGLAILTHSRSDPRFFKRDSPDVDFIVSKDDRHKLESFFQTMGYSPNRQFNLLNGAHRQIYYHDQLADRRIDILVGDFEMCHKLPLDGRLDVDPITIPLAELLLSKAQVIELNRKDALDIISLLLNNEIGDEREGRISLDRIAWLCSHDWGLYKTTSINLERVEAMLADKDMGLAAEECDLILSRVRKIQKAFNEMPKSMQWKMRDKVGTRVRWYEEVEEVAR